MDPSELPVVSHFRSTDLIQPLKDPQPVTAHFRGSFRFRRFQSNPDLATNKLVELNRFDRIPSPPVCGPEVLMLHKKMEKIKPFEKKKEKTRLFVLPPSLESGTCQQKKAPKTDPGSDAEEIDKLCQGFSGQMVPLK
ncbi:uncharacterized protein LOC129743565 [Uranotaenia lowii]|uniref:uncharacterized protein LOC129743565 n=1 Tax=Uranotaenia lowii TaxID=190385 RepID=UPI00247AC9A8|nr:uncharacterized protein LOC129743565 [Uranotaenia lowii]